MVHLAKMTYRNSSLRQTALKGSTLLLTQQKCKFAKKKGALAADFNEDEPIGPMFKQNWTEVPMKH